MGARRFAGFLAGLALAVSAFAAAPAQAAPSGSTPKPKAGVVCTKVNATAKSASTSLKCVRNAAGKLRWVAIKPRSGSVKAGTVTPSTLLPGAVVTRSSVSTPMAMEFATSVPAGFIAAVRGPSGYEIQLDPQDGGSPEVVYPDPSDAEQPNSSLAPAVTGLTLVSRTETAATVSFTPRSDVTGAYQVYLRYDDSFTLKGADGSSPVVQFTDLTPGWDYVVCAYYLQPRESERACLNLRTLGTRPVEPTPVAGPSSVVATAVDDTIEVTWAEMPGVQRYSVSIERNSSFQSGGYRELNGARNHVRFNSGSVSPGLLYSVRVTALLESGQWTTESITTVRANGSAPLPPTKLPAPTNLRVVDVTPTSVTVAWDADSATAASVTAWQVVARYQTSYTATGAFPNDRSLTIRNLNPGYGYQIIISGFNSTTGIWTEESRVSVLLPPQAP